MFCFKNITLRVNSGHKIVFPKTYKSNIRTDSGRKILRMFQKITIFWFLSGSFWFLVRLYLPRVDPSAPYLFFVFSFFILVSIAFISVTKFGENQKICSRDEGVPPSRSSSLRATHCSFFSISGHEQNQWSGTCRVGLLLQVHFSADRAVRIPYDSDTAVTLVKTHSIRHPKHILSTSESVHGEKS